jgi:uncharacterized protein
MLDRRTFLLKTATLVTGSLLGVDRFSHALAAKDRFSPVPHPRLSLIIDDIGYCRSRARLFLKLQVPLTFSVLPRLSDSRSTALEIHESGHEVMLHQPMEPYGSLFDPGPGALYVGDENRRISRIIEENILQIPFAKGVNNHMGSRFTGCPKEIRSTLGAIREKGLFFVDSLTSNRSVAYRVARQFQMPTACRDIFLDNQRQVPAILSQLEKLKIHALKWGSAVGIGHPFPETAIAIERFSRKLEGSGISLVHISKVLNG